MREVKLPSGAVLKITPAPFAVSKALYQALLRELKGVTMGFEITQNVFKDLFCAGFSSSEVETCLWECLKRCLYNDLKIDDQTFEPVERREDYLKVCVEVTRDNVFPFAKVLYAEYLNALTTTASTPK